MPKTACLHPVSADPGTGCKSLYFDVMKNYIFLLVVCGLVFLASVAEVLAPVFIFLLLLSVAGWLLTECQPE